MGASEWKYSVAYQEDIIDAFEELRQHTFETGAYYKPWDTDDEDDEDDYGLAEEPESIEELLELNETDGTHSILDMHRVALAPLARGDEGKFGVVYPLAAASLVELFGTAKPTAAMVEALEQQSPGRLVGYAPGRWRGIYFTLYKDDKPDGYYFTGYSGD